MAALPRQRVLGTVRRGRKATVPERLTQLNSTRSGGAEGAMRKRHALLNCVWFDQAGSGAHGANLAREVGQLVRVEEHGFAGVVRSRFLLVARVKSLRREGESGTASGFELNSVRQFLERGRHDGLARPRSGTAGHVDNQSRAYNSKLKVPC